MSDDCSPLLPPSLPPQPFFFLFVCLPRPRFCSPSPKNKSRGELKIRIYPEPPLLGAFWWAPKDWGRLEECLWSPLPPPGAGGFCCRGAFIPVSAAIFVAFFPFRPLFRLPAGEITARIHAGGAPLERGGGTAQANASSPSSDSSRSRAGAFDF